MEPAKDPADEGGFTVRSAGRRAAALAATLGLLATAGCSLFGSGNGPDAAARAFLGAWGRGDSSGAAAQTNDPGAARAGLDALHTGLGAAKVELTLGDVATEGDGRATAHYAAAWTLPAVSQPWRYEGTLPLLRADKAWRVRWEPADLHPKLTAGRTIRVVRELPERAALQDSAGKPLFSRQDVVTVGVEPAKVGDLPKLAATLASVLRLDAAQIAADARRAKPNAFVPVVTLRRADYLRVKPRVYDLPGTAFRSEQRLLGPTASFAQPLLGRVGEATAEVLNEAGDRYRTGDQIGVSGLQRALNPRLAGTAGARIEARSPSGPPTMLGSVAGAPGAPVRTTLDRAVQQASDAAVAGSATPAAIVAVRPSTGAILAVANNEAAPYDIALAGRYPAGSTFKVVTATALLSAGAVQPASAVACPATTVVYGKRFQNENRFDLGRVPVRTAFAKSCNTTFTALSQRLDDAALPATAAAYGVGSRWSLPVSSFGGSVPAPKDDTEKAADAIGQGRVEVSPLAMALVSASVARGAAVTPSLLAGQPATPAGTPPAGPPTAVLPALRDMMRAVVTEGTATGLRDLPGGPVAGKTGTAEYGTAVPPRSHAWFTGYQGDLAFAVFVQDGQSSGTTAVPLARAFLSALR
ncbi:MAG TPA: penicillin-binding transpeptidase domain-containing protein [Mycobacteriales bacterium]|nr:penicillin-binding transpeptidase domain-containing protein [Mycobacteriales bacterium]